MYRLIIGGAAALLAAGYGVLRYRSRNGSRKGKSKAADHKFVKMMNNAKVKFVSLFKRKKVQTET